MAARMARVYTKYLNTGNPTYSIRRHSLSKNPKWIKTKSSKPSDAESATSELDSTITHTMNLTAPECDEDIKQALMFVLISSKICLALLQDDLETAEEFSQTINQVIFGPTSISTISSQKIAVLQPSHYRSF